MTDVDMGCVEADAPGQGPGAGESCGGRDGSTQHHVGGKKGSKPGSSSGLDWDAWGKSQRNERVEKKIRAAKRAARSELSVSKGEWRKHGYAEKDILRVDEGIVDALPRVDVRSTSQAEFFQRYEKACRPCVLTHACDEWPAMRRWTLEELKAEYGNTKCVISSLRRAFGSAYYAPRETNACHRRGPLSLPQLHP